MNVDGKGEPSEPLHENESGAPFERLPQSVPWYASDANAGVREYRAQREQPRRGDVRACEVR